jgi:hypothetical protein
MMQAKLHAPRRGAPIPGGDRNQYADAAYGSRMVQGRSREADVCAAPLAAIEIERVSHRGRWRYP